MHVFKCFWTDVAFTAFHLINMVHSSTLDGKTPFLVLYSEKQVFDLPLKFSGVCVLFKFLKKDMIN